MFISYISEAGGYNIKRATGFEPTGKIHAQLKEANPASA
jgi:hypothetical protein